MQSCRGGPGESQSRRRGGSWEQRWTRLLHTLLWARGGLWWPLNYLPEWTAGASTSVPGSGLLATESPCSIPPPASWTLLWEGRCVCAHVHRLEVRFCLCDVFSECETRSPTSGTSTWPFLCVHHSLSSDQCPAWGERGATGPCPGEHTSQVGRRAVPRWTRYAVSRATEEEGRVQRCGRVHVQMCVQHGGRGALGPGRLPHRASPGRHRPPETSPDSRGADGHPSTRGISKELGGRVLKPPYLTQILQKNHSGWEACWLCPSEHKETAGAAQRGLGEREASCGQWSAPGGGTGSPEVSQQRASGPGRAQGSLQRGQWQS